MKNEKGISLIILVITILIILTLVGIFFANGFGQNGIVKEATNAEQKSYHDNVIDALLILQTSYSSKSQYYDYLKNNGYIDSKGVVFVKTLLESTKCELGVGSNYNDVYVLNSNMDLAYYDKNGKMVDLGNIGNTMED